MVGDQQEGSTFPNPVPHRVRLRLGERRASGSGPGRGQGVRDHQDVHVLQGGPVEGGLAGDNGVAVIPQQVRERPIASVRGVEVVVRLVDDDDRPTGGVGRTLHRGIEVGVRGLGLRAGGDGGGDGDKHSRRAHPAEEPGCREHADLLLSRLAPVGQPADSPRPPGVLTSASRREIVERRMAPTLLLATGNPGKVREMRASLAGAGFRLLGLGDLPEPGPEEPEETGEGFLANAGIKALHYQAASGIPALAEDSGLEVDALGGGPGVRSSRWLGRDTPYSEKNRHLLKLLAANPARGRRARYRSAVAIAVAGRIVFRSTGAVEGEIAGAPRGSGGFGYDPVFLAPDYGKTMAELTIGEKQRISHRGRALGPARLFLAAAVAARPPIIR